ncbi:MAG: arsenate reductase (glutaredoxin) [Gammaproteobacteria bacterium]|nr:arsenate reductase (glutaredoxin) [Gammaproteobacteria bacterium]
MSIKIYHNPRCSKSRKALELLEQQGLNPEIVKYLDTPPDENELRNIIRQLGVAARDLLRKGEEEFKLAGLSDENLDDDTVIKAMLAFPKLIERPIVIHGNKAIIGRPPEKVLDII